MKCSTHRTSTSTYMSQCVSLAFALPLYKFPSLRKAGWKCFTECPGVLSGKKSRKPKTVQESWIVNGSPPPWLVTLCESTLFYLFQFAGCDLQLTPHSTQALLELHKVMTVMMSPLRFYKCLMVLEHRSQPMGTGDWHSTASWWQNRAVE